MTLRSLAASIALVLPACATLGSAQSADPTDPVTRGGQELRAPAGAGAAVPHLDFMAVPQSFPSLRGDADLPSANNVAMHMQKVLGDTAAADIRVCVAPSGQVASVKLVKSSGLASYDQAVLHDVRAWDFAAPTGATACEDATIVYTLR